MSATILFEQWRTERSPDKSWGLAWFLANEFCRRFYASHGLVPWVINHEGMGYYGIGVYRLPCGMTAGDGEAIGRFTMDGNVENWRDGGPGDHGCELVERCGRGVPTEELVMAAVAHLGVLPLPEASHLHCRHKRWGDSYALCFEIATIVALRHGPGAVEIWNDPEQIRRDLEEDPKRGMKEHPGGFVFASESGKVCVTGDGRVLDGSGTNLWHEYMSGKSANRLADLIRRKFLRKWKVSDLFEDEPIQWGLRGDPFLWRELKLRLMDIDMPVEAGELQRLIEQEFESAVGYPVTHRDPVCVERFKHGGMSSGYIDFEFWRDTAMPLFSRRQQSCNS